VEETELQRLLHELESGPACWFADWPNLQSPPVAAGVYTVWEGETFLYVGMAGRTLTRETIAEKLSARSRPTGIVDRLGSHALGRRSGDQFCVYVCDLLILPSLNPEQIQQIARRELSLDGLVRSYIRERLTYRYVEVSDGAAAFALEREVKRRGFRGRPPLLNP
jgi:hypothetical protein